MIKQISILVLAIALFFIDINSIGIPYIIFVLGCVFYMVIKKKYNELALAFPLFGYSFGILVNKITGVPNLFFIVLFVALLLGYRLFFFFNGKIKINSNQGFLMILYGLFFISILFSLFQFYQDDYPISKLQLFGMWGLIYLLSFNSFDNETDDFDYESFLIIVFLLFVPHFSNATDDGNTLSPSQVWNTYSILDNGIRGHDFDIISATRIAGAGILAYLIYIYDFEKRKIYLFGLLSFFVVMLIICQTRQSIAALAFPLFIFGLFVLAKGKMGFNRIIIAVVVLVSTMTFYVNYLNKNNVESRIITSAEGKAEEGTGREDIWGAAVSFINSDKASVGFGNYARFTGSATYPHNIFLEIYVELGLFAFLILCIIVVYMAIELIKIFSEKKALSTLELFLILETTYYFGLAQFSVDLSRNMMFLYTFALFIVIRYQKKNVIT